MAIVEFQNYFIFILVSLFSLLCYFLFFRKPEVGYNLPPSPPSLPIIGHLHLFFSVVMHKSLQKLSSKYGSILHLRIFTFPVVLVSSASATYKIFKAQDLNLSSRDPPVNDKSIVFGSLSFSVSPYGDYWKFMKKILITHLLGPQALERSRSVRSNEVKRFYSNLLDKAMRKESVGIAEEVMKLINNTICRLIMGTSWSEETGEAERIRDLLTECGGFTKKSFLASMVRKPLAKLGISLFQKEKDDLSRRFDEVFEKILMDYEEKQADLGGDDDMINVLLKSCKDENAVYKITRNHIKSLFVELFFAGTGSTTHTIQWIMAEIINNPNILERLRDEIDSVVGKTRLIQENDLPNLPYLQAIVKEGLRLHPPGPLVPRTFKEECNIGNFYVKEKTMLLVNFYSVMRDPDSWEQPNEFNPERFIVSSRAKQEEEVKEKVLNYIPFGMGRRACPGSNLAYLSIGTAIGVMVQGFDWKIKGDNVNMEEARGEFILSMANPLTLTPVPRTLNLLTSSM